MRIQALFIRKTILEFGNAQHFAGCGCPLSLFADSLRCTQSADCRIYRVQEKYHKDPTFFFDVYCCTHRLGWRSQRQSEKVNIRNACFLPVRAKCGRFCVLMDGRAFLRTESNLSFGLQQQSTLRADRAEVCIHLIWIGFLFRRTQSRFGNKESTTLSISRRGDQRTLVAFCYSRV